MKKGFIVRLYEETYRNKWFAFESEEAALERVADLLRKNPKPAFSINILVTARESFEKENEK